MTETIKQCVPIENDKLDTIIMLLKEILKELRNQEFTEDIDPEFLHYGYTLS